MSAALFASVNGRILFLAKKCVNYRFIDAHRIGLELLFNCLGLCLGGHIEFERHKVPVNIAHMQRHLEGVAVRLNIHPILSLIRLFGQRPLATGNALFPHGQRQVVLDQFHRRFALGCCIQPVVFFYNLTGGFQPVNGVADLKIICNSTGSQRVGNILNA